MRRILVLLSALLATPASAELIHADPSSFLVKHRLVAPVGAEVAFDALLHVERWWGGDHTWSGDAKNISIEPRVRGCWCERWPDAEIEHGRILYIKKNSNLRLTGSLGPLQDMAVNAVLDYTLTPGKDGTQIDMMYRVTGADSSQLDGVAAIVDKVMVEQMLRLKSHLDQLAPPPPAPEAAPASGGAPTRP
jgi:uncharacterized protein YndB with AHSA1/START domain